MIAEEAGRRSWLLTNLPKPSEMTFATGGDLFARCPTNTRIQGPFQYAARAARQASDLNPVRIFHRVLLETRFAQEVSVRL